MVFTVLESVLQDREFGYCWKSVRSLCTTTRTKTVKRNVVRCVNCVRTFDATRLLSVAVHDDHCLAHLKGPHYDSVLNLENSGNTVTKVPERINCLFDSLNRIRKLPCKLTSFINSDSQHSRLKFPDQCTFSAWL